jgi:peptidylprolyl isomerase
MQRSISEYSGIIILLVGCVALISGLAYWAGDTEERQLARSEQLNTPLVPDEYEVYNPEVSNTMNPIAVLETNKGAISIELYRDTMPVTAGNFEKLIQEGFYDGIQFHRVIGDFMIQGGDPNTKTDNVLLYGTGGPGYAIADEHVAGELLSNRRGTISMANSGPNSGGSQFFINLKDNTFLDFDKEPLSSKHPVFGRVVDGMEVVDAIAAVETNERDLPVTPIVIEKAYIQNKEY